MAETRLRFVHISDTHLTADPDYTSEYATHHPLTGFRALVASINALPFTPDFILHTGDVAYDPYPDVYPMIKDELSRLKAPVYVVAGNHDHMGAIQSVIMGRSDDAIQPALHYELDINGVQLIAVDSNAAAPPPAGRIADDQLTWLESLCKADDPRQLIIAVHHNILKTGVPWLDDWMRTVNGDDFHSAIKPAAHRLRGVFHGHIHQNIDTYKDGILYSAAASSWSQFYSYPIPENVEITPDHITPPGYSVVHVTDDRTFIRRHTFSVDAS